MKKRLVALVSFVFILSFAVIGLAQAADPFTGTITGNMTLNVPAEFADINAALTYLSNKSIADGVTVTIKVADGSYNYSSQINVSHRDGDKISILGNSANPSLCTLNFASGLNGFYINKNSRIGNIEGFQLVSAGGTNGVGVFVNDHSYAKLNNMVITGFYFSNVGAYVGSTIRATNVTVKNSPYTGLAAYTGSTIYATSCTADGNSTGYLSHQVSLISAHSCTAKNNNIGFNADSGAFVYAQSVTNINNVTNFSPAANTEGNDNSFLKNF